MYVVPKHLIGQKVYAARVVELTEKTSQKDLMYLYEEVGYKKLIKTAEEAPKKKKKDKSE